MGLDNPIHIAFLLILLLLVFGAKRLPEMGRSLGEGMHGFKQAIGGATAHDSTSVEFAPSTAKADIAPSLAKADIAPSPVKVGIAPGLAKADIPLSTAKADIAPGPVKVGIAPQPVDVDRNQAA